MGLTMTSTIGDGGSLHRYPGTSCLATIRLSLRDKSHSPIKGFRIKFALIGFQPPVLNPLAPPDPGRQIAPNPYLSAIRYCRLTIPFAFSLLLESRFAAMRCRETRLQTSG